MSDIKIAIQKLADTKGIDQAYLLTCTVDSVNIPGRLCMVTAVNNNIASFPAQLMAEIDDGILISPTVSSTVKVLFSNHNAPTVIQFSQIDSVYIVAGGSTIHVYNNGIELNGTEYGGIPQVSPLASAIAAIQKDLNDLKTAIADWTPVANDGGAAFNVSLGKNYPTTQFTIMQQSDIENTTVKHGNGQ